MKTLKSRSTRISGRVLEESYGKLEDLYREWSGSISKIGGLVAGYWLDRKGRMAMVAQRSYNHKPHVSGSSDRFLKPPSGTIKHDAYMSQDNLFRDAMNGLAEKHGKWTRGQVDRAIEEIKVSLGSGDTVLGEKRMLLPLSKAFLVEMFEETGLIPLDFSFFDCDSIPNTKKGPYPNEKFPRFHFMIRSMLGPDEDGENLVLNEEVPVVSRPSPIDDKVLEMIHPVNMRDILLDVTKALEKESYPVSLSYHDMIARSIRANPLLKLEPDLGKDFYFSGLQDLAR